MIVAIGRVSPMGVELLGTGFIIGESLVATAAHITAAKEDGLCVVFKSSDFLNEYQDTTNSQVQYNPAVIRSFDATSDVAILECAGQRFGPICNLRSTDTVKPLDGIFSLGYPHCVDGRMVLTAQTSTIGARVILDCGGAKRKHLVLNVLTRPGQSGSPIFSDYGARNVIAMILGSYRPSGNGTILIGNVDPAALNQTTHAISAEYIKEMINA